MSVDLSRKLRHAPPAAALVGAALFLYLPVLKPGVFLYGLDTIHHDYILFSLGWGGLRQGLLFRWLPYLYSGIPFIGSFAFCPFYPVSWLFLILPFPLAFNLQYVVHGVLAGAFMYRFLRILHMKRFPALFGALGFQVSGHLVTLCYPGHLQKVQAIVWFPLAMAFLHKGLFSPKRRYFLLTGCALAMPLLTSHPQIYYYSILALCLYFIWALGNRKHQALSAPPLRLLAFFVLAILFSLALSAVQILPGYETSRYSVRGDGLSYEEAVKSSYPPGELLELVLPRYTGDSIRGGYGHYWGEWGERLVSDYLGMGVVLLAFVGSLLSRRLLRFFFTGLFLLGVLVACGGYSPVFRLLFEIVPGMNRFRCPATVMFLLSFSAAILAAFGLEALGGKVSAQEQDKIPWRKKITNRFLILSVLFLLTTIFLHQYYGRIHGKYLEYERNGAGSSFFYLRMSFIVSSLRRSVFFACVTFSSLCLLFYSTSLVRAGRIPSLVVGIVQTVFLILYVADPGFNNRAFIQPEPVGSYHQYLYDSWPDPLLKKAPQPVRLLEIGNELSNRHVANRIGVPLGYHPIELQDYLDAWNAVAGGILSASRLTACRYILAPREMRMDKKMTPVASSSGAAKILYQWPPEAVSYAYVPETVESLGDPNAVLLKMSGKEFDPHKTSFILSEDKISRKRTHPLKEYLIKVQEYEPNHVILRMDLPEESFVILADTWMPGWKAVLEDQTPVPMHIANHAFRCLKIPKGKHTITMVYQPASLYYGMIISIIALALGIGLYFYKPRFSPEAKSCAVL